MTYSYYGKTPQLNVYDTQTNMANNPGGATANAGQAVVYDQSENTVRFHFGTTNPPLSANSKIRVMGKFYDTTADTTNGDFVNGREFTVASVGSESVGGALNYYVECSTAGMNFPDSDFNLAVTTGNNVAKIYSSESTAVEAFFEGAQNVYKGATENFSNKKIVMREIGTSTKHDYTNAQMVTKTTAAGAAKNIIDDLVEVFTLKDDKTGSGTTLDTYELTGLGENTNAAT